MPQSFRLTQLLPLLMSAAAIALMLLAALVGPNITRAQVDCEDPLDASQPSFNTSFWNLTDFCTRSVSFDELRSGGPPPDGIPPIDNPQFEDISAAREWLSDESPVVVVEIDGDARAYPLAVLTWHEIVNDVFGDVPVAVTFCPLCNSAIVFDRRVDGQTLRMGVSGLLRNSDLVMWDDVTQSFWQQLTGEGIVGAFTGTRMTPLSSQLLSLALFEEQYPDGAVLTRETGFTRSYGRNPYTGYDSLRQPFLFSGELDERLPALERVLGLELAEDETFVAYSFSALSEVQVVNDTVAGRELVVFWQAGAVSALDAGQIDQSRDVGVAVLFERTLDGEVLSFSLTDEGQFQDDQTGSTWNVFGEALDGELVGSQLDQVIAAPHFWFAWAAFHPDTTVYGLE